MGRCDVCHEKNTAGCACTRREEAEYEVLRAQQIIPEKLDEIIMLLKELKELQKR